jgi:hypothetical protein
MPNLGTCCTTPSSGIFSTSLTKQQHCVCVTGLLDACYVAQTNAGVDCGKPVYPVRLSIVPFYAHHH